MSIPPTAVIIAAGGAGRRLGSRRPKALIEVEGSPLLFHSLVTFADLSFVREIVVVLPRSSMAAARRNLGRHLKRLGMTGLIAGGTRRQDSVLNGLRATTSPIVLVHDAARPLVTARAVRAVARAAARHGAAVLAAPAVDTLKISDARGRVKTTPDRRHVWHAQTPQGFRRTVLENAYRKSGRRDATDDVQLVERAGGSVIIVPSLDPNPKVTTKTDLDLVRRLLRDR